jgi:colanic acid/amylovoran biosynthesis protein
VSEFIDAMEEADLVVASGGGYITDDFPEMVEGVCGVLAVAQRLGKPTAMFGQGLGPLRDPRLRKLARAGMAGLQLITLREDLKSPSVATELGIPKRHVEITGDDAIELAHDLRSTHRGTKLGLNIRAANYSAVAPSDLHPLRAVIKRIASDLGAEPQVLPISFFNKQDMMSTNALLDRSEAAELPRLHGPEDVIRLVGECRVVITGSYHAGVFALAQGIPVVGLAKSSYYRDKFEGLAAQFGEGCVCLNLGGRDLPEKLHKTTLELSTAAERLRPLLLERAEFQIRCAQNAYGRLQEMLCAA